ncbi:unnamed protein product [Spirodela intermedia]|uniref:PI31 proteasome regulator N-terminal domain-containing protein n=1 Tax=Spirodela intermedia TaxID=51605 RepID=A0A7I8IKD6_SPIIN|nr:unnamed protein product [Spirodela intermedia]CAA6658349.1 unnamed protein product [Spirodela intermedia]
MATETSVMGVIRASRPSFRNSHDKATFALHAAFLAAGYALTATGRAALAGSPPEEVLTPMSALEILAGEEEVGIEGWNEFEDSYGFVYAKRTEKGEKRGFSSSACPSGMSSHVKDYVPEDSARTGNYERFYQNFKRLVDSFNKNVLAELELPAEVGCSSSTERGEVPGHVPSPPDAESHIGTQPYSPLVYPLLFLIPGLTISTPGPAPASSPEVNGRYLPSSSSPLSENPHLTSLCSSFGIQGAAWDGSMLVGPHDPRFGRVDRPDLGYPGGLGNPTWRAYDPIGPPDVPGFEPGRFIRPPRRPGGGTHPDLEHFQGPDYF